MGEGDRLHPLIPHQSKRWKPLYRGRAAVERESPSSLAMALKTLRAGGFAV